MVDMALHSAHRHVKLVGDLAIRAAPTNELYDLKLAPSDAPVRTGRRLLDDIASDRERVLYR